jgi:hypothetical protein
MLRYLYFCCFALYFSGLYSELNDDFLYQRGAALEIYVSKVVHVNGKALDKTAKVTLIGGDEVVFSSLGRHAYVSFFTTIYFFSASLCSFALIKTLLLVWMMVQTSICLGMDFLNVLADISATSKGKIKHIIFVFNICQTRRKCSTCVEMGLGHFRHCMEILL